MVMKELSIEEKAKRYDEALERAKEINNEQHAQPFNVMTRVFPELKEKESDDERIRKDIISHFTKRIEGSSFDEVREKYKIWIAWLEKQDIDISSFPKEQQEFMLKYISLDKITLIKLLAERDANNAEIIESFEKQGEQKSFAKYKVGDTIYYNSFGRLVSFVIANIIEDGTDNPMYEDKDGNSVFQNDIVEQKPTNKQFTPEQADVLDKYIDKYLEQKPVNKIESKFKVGDWVVYNDNGCICQIKSIREDDYCLWPLDSDVEGYLKITDIDNKYHLWTIQDAKDGDILVTMDDERPFIYKGCLDSNHPDSPVAYCGINSKGYFQISGDKFAIWWTDMNVQPATKEQCDLLFQKMKEAGYEWDSEKKKLVEPKFYEGNWVVRGKTVAQIHDIQEQYYIGLDINGNDFTSSRFLSDDKIHLWTIQDAKDGNVLSNGTTIFIFKDLLSDGSVMSYCDYDTNSGESDAFCPLPMNLTCSKITPATKEQSDTLLKAMADAGYTFDFEKKELKKIKQKSYGQRQECSDCQFNYAGECKGSCVMKRGEQKHGWSEEDEKNINSLCELLTDLQVKSTENEIKHGTNSHSKYYHDIKEWLKSLQKRIIN